MSAEFFSAFALCRWRQTGELPTVRGPWRSMADAMRDASKLLEDEYDSRVDDCEQQSEADDLRLEYEGATTAFDVTESTIVISSEREFYGWSFMVYQADSDLGRVIEARKAAQ